MKLKDHFKFNLSEAKQLAIAFTGAISTWAATGFSRDLPHLMYVIVGFLTGGLAAHSTMASPNVLPDSHIITPYANNIDDKTNVVPEQEKEVEIYKPEGTDVKKVIKINSSIIK